MATSYVTDQGIRPDTNLEALVAAQAGVQGGRQDHGRQLLADLRRRRGGAADVAPRRPRSSGCAARARIVDQTTVGVDPVTMLTGPIPATRRSSERNGMTIDDIDLIEINEAFAPVVAAWQRELVPGHGPRQRQRRRDRARAPARARPAPA